MPRTRRRLRTRILSVIAIVVLVFAAVSIPLYVLPGDQSPRAADVVFVIGPPTDARLEYAQQLLDAGEAHALMISTVLRNPDGTPAQYGFSPRSDQLCRNGDGATPVYCIQADPFTTQGEARALRAAMSDHGWSRALVVTMTPHVNRTRLIMSRCVASGVQVIGIGDNLFFDAWVKQYVYQTGAFVKALATPYC